MSTSVTSRFHDSAYCICSNQLSLVTFQHILHLIISKQPQSPWPSSNAWRVALPLWSYSNDLFPATPPKSHHSPPQMTIHGKSAWRSYKRGERHWSFSKSCTPNTLVPASRNVDILQGIILSWPVHPHSILVWLHNVILCDVGTCQLWQQFASCLGHWSQGDPWPCFVCNFTQTNANQTLKHSSLPNHSTHYNEALQVARCWCLGKLTSLKHFPWFQAPSKPLWIFSVYEPPGLCNTGNDTFQKARVLLATTPQVVKASWRSRVKDGSISGRSLTLKKKTPKTKTTY